ncbi:hypothetical protein RhiLY_11421 [Ceratobasidium sp. AG-Ba]|nr:hypothetical protein RhiLY_11421 [Ceratobasidium sp. AG-Ba]
MVESRRDAHRSEGVDLHLRRNERCGALHEEWEKKLASANTNELSSAAPSLVESSSSSEDSDAFDSRPARLSNSDSDSDQLSPHSAEPQQMDVDSPSVKPNTPSPEPPAVDEDPSLTELKDANGNVVYAEQFPNPKAGRHIRRVKLEDLPARYRKYPNVGSLSNPECFEIAQLLMESGVSGRFRNRFLTLKRIKDRMPWANDRAMLIDVDKLPHGPDWEVKSWTIHGNRGDESVEFWKRNSLDAIKQLLLDRTLGRKMCWRPVRHWTCRRKKSRRRDELWTADWMWDMQEKIKDEYATLIPYIVMSDETRLTNFAGDKRAHPVYLTVGNIPKRLRRRVSKRATILIGYLPVPKLDCESSDEEKRTIKRDLFHRCMEEILAPLVEASTTGELAPCADGYVRRIYPKLAAYVGDFPEQCKVACTKQTHCPLCTVHPKNRGDLGDSELRDAKDVLTTMERRTDKGARRFERQGLLPIRPFWTDHEEIELGSFITPDLLHQVHKGVMKDHLIKWVTTHLGKPVLDERYVSMPDCQGMRHFKNGISTVSQWTGRELKEMVKILLPAISDGNERVVRAARSLMDFMYLAHYSSLTDEDLDAMEDALRTFHDHKDVFEEIGAVATNKGFHGIPKIHMISHYTHLIRRLGTPDGYNTETSERLHIDFAKMGYRASNKVNATKQMALYIQRLEAIAMHAAHLAAMPGSGPRCRNPSQLVQELAEIIDEDPDYDDDEDDEDDWDAWFYEEEDPEELQRAGVIVRPDEDFFSREWDVMKAYYEGKGGEKMGTKDLFHPNPVHVTAKTPTNKALTAEEITRTHGAAQFVPALETYLRNSDPTLSNVSISAQHRFHTWSRARLCHSAPPYNPAEGPSVDVVRAQPMKKEGGRVTRRSRFDTVLLLHRSDQVGVRRYRIGRVRVIFQLPSALDRRSQGPLVYADVFDQWSQLPSEPTGLYTVKPKFTARNVRVCVILPLSQVRMTCHLAPCYESRTLDTWLNVNSDVYALFPTFFFNIFANHQLYGLLRHWEQDGMWRSEKPEEPATQVDADQDGKHYEPIPEPGFSDEEAGDWGSDQSEDNDGMDVDEDASDDESNDRPAQRGRPASQGRASQAHRVRGRGGGRGRGWGLVEAGSLFTERGGSSGRALAVRAGAGGGSSVVPCAVDHDVCDVARTPTIQSVCYQFIHPLRHPDRMVVSPYSLSLHALPVVCTLVHVPSSNSYMAAIRQMPNRAYSRETRLDPQPHHLHLAEHWLLWTLPPSTSPGSVFRFPMTHAPTMPGKARDQEMGGEDDGSDRDWVPGARTGRGCHRIECCLPLLCPAITLGLLCRVMFCRLTLSRVMCYRTTLLVSQRLTALIAALPGEGVLGDRES